MISGLVRRVLGPAVLVAVAGLCTLPWAVRNAVTMGIFTPGTTHSGYTFLHGNTPLAWEDYLAEPMDVDPENRFDNLPEPERQARQREKAAQLIREHPGRYAALTVVRAARLWLNVGFGKAPSARSLAIMAINLAALALAGAGAWRMQRAGRWEHWPVLVLLAVHTGSYSLIMGYVRFSFPMMPMVLALAAGIGISDLRFEISEVDGVDGSDESDRSDG